MARSGNQPEKKTTLDIIRHYIDQGQQDGLIYGISFRGNPTSVPRLKGIEGSLMKNFGANYSSTPIAIYGYPLIPDLLSRTKTTRDDTFNDYMSSRDDSQQYQIFRIKPDAKGIVIIPEEDGGYYNKYNGGLDKDVLLSEFPHFIKKIKESIPDAKESKPYKAALKTYKSFDIAYETLREALTELTPNKVSQYLALFLKRNGVQYIVDEGTGLIHDGEPYQIAIMDAGAIEGVYADYNRNYSTLNRGITTFDDAKLLELFKQGRYGFVFKIFGNTTSQELMSALNSVVTENILSISSNDRKLIEQYIKGINLQTTDFYILNKMISVAKNLTFEDEIIPVIKNYVNTSLYKEYYFNIINGHEYSSIDLNALGDYDVLYGNKIIPSKDIDFIKYSYSAKLLPQRNTTFASEFKRLGYKYPLYMWGLKPIQEREWSTTLRVSWKVPSLMANEIMQDLEKWLHS